MFSQKISQNIDILAGIHGNMFLWQPTIIVNKASLYWFIFKISSLYVYLPSLYEFPRISKSRRHLLYVKDRTEIMVISRIIPKAK